MDGQKRLVLMRGLPGSGKSTAARKIAGQLGVVYSTDDFFMVKGQYVYNPTKIGEYHQKNLQRTVQAMKDNIKLIVIDNTNIKLWQMKKYVFEAQKFGYHIQIVQPQTPWAFNYKQCAKKNTHGVPQDKVKIMCDNYQTFQTIQDIKSAKQNFRRNPRPKK